MGRKSWLPERCSGSFFLVLRDMRFHLQGCLPFAVSLVLGCGTASESPSTNRVKPQVEAQVQVIRTPSIAPDFTNVSARLGLNAPFYSDTIPGRYFLPEVMGGGVSWLDFDRDGTLDLYLTNGTKLDGDRKGLPRGNWLYRGVSGESFRLVDEAVGAADQGYGQGSAAGDFNADGFPDLYVGNFGVNALYVNQGDGTYTLDRTATAVADPSWTSSVLWIDVNRDQLLDIYAVNYLKISRTTIKQCEYGDQPGYCGPGQYEFAPDKVFLNLGNGEFLDASEQLGFTDNFGKGLAILAADLDDDRVPEIYVANDMTPNFLYQLQAHNAGDQVRYVDIAESGGAARSGEGMNEASMGIACDDFDGDQRPDIFLTHYFNMQDTLYLNRGGLQFEDASRRMGTAHIGYLYLGFGVVPIDFDGDEFTDLFITNGHVLGPAVKPDRMPPQLLKNDSGKRFEDISASAGEYFSQQRLGRGAAIADYDDDGDLDVAVTHLDEPPALLHNSTQTGKAFVGFSLSDDSRILPLGTKVTVKSREKSQTRTLKAGGSYLSSSDARLMFHLSPTDERIDVIVEWSSGKTDRFDALESNRYWHIHEGRKPW